VRGAPHTAPDRRRIPGGEIERPIAAYGLLFTPAHPLNEIWRLNGGKERFFNSIAMASQKVVPLAKAGVQNRYNYLKILDSDFL
jgi:hypothetical protein